MFKNLVKDTVIYGFGDFVFKLMTFLIFPIYANIFTVEEFGIMNLILTFAGFFAIFLNLGVNNSINRFYWDVSIKEEGKPTLVTTGLYIVIVNSFFITTIMVFFMYLLSDYIYFKYKISFILVFLALFGNIFSQILQYCLDLLRLHFTPVKYLIVSAIKNLSGVFLGLLLITLFNQKLEGYFNGILYATAFSTPLAIWMIKKDINFKFDKKIAKELIGFGYPFIFSGIAYWIFSSMDRIMLAEISDNTNVGIYSISNKFATIVLFINSAFGQAWSPFAMKIMNEDKNYKELFGKVFTYLFFLLSFIGMVISLFSYEILFMTTPKEYWVAANCMMFSIMGVVISGTTQITGIGISIEKKTKLFSVISWVTALVNFVFNLILIPSYGASGSAFATLISYSLLTLSYLYWTQKLHTLPLEKANLLFCCFIVISSIVSAIVFNSFEWDIKISLYKIILCTIILIVAILLKIINLSEAKIYLKSKFSK